MWGNSLGTTNIINMGLSSNFLPFILAGLGGLDDGSKKSRWPDKQPLENGSLKKL